MAEWGCRLKRDTMGPFLRRFGEQGLTLPGFKTGFRQAGQALLREMKLQAPVGIYPKGSGRAGGQLRRTLGTAEEFHQRYARIRVGASVHYAPYLEFEGESGHRTRRRRGPPMQGESTKFIRPAFRVAKEALRRLLNQAFRRILGER